jgi:membrane protein DedA with SNARE-associated domain
MLSGEVVVLTIVAYVLGSIVSFFIGRQMGIKIGSVLTFDLFTRLGYVKYYVDERGEVVLQKVSESQED